MRSNRMWIGVTCGVALALGGVAAVEAGTQTAGATPTCPSAQSVPNPNYPNCPPAHVTIVKKSPARVDRKSHPFTVSIRQHWIDQKIAATALRRRLWVSLASSGKIIHQSRPKPDHDVMVTHNVTGKYVVNFQRNVSACSWTASPSLVGSFANQGDPLTAVTARPPGQPTAITVYVYKASTLTNSNVAVQVLC